jgi:hypothetical protein
MIATTILLTTTTIGGITLRRGAEAYHSLMPTGLGSGMDRMKGYSFTYRGGSPLSRELGQLYPGGVTIRSRCRVNSKSGSVFSRQSSWYRQGLIVSSN